MHLQQNLIPACKRRMKCHRNAFFQFLPDGAGCGISPLFRNRQKNRGITVWNISAVQRLPENIICVNPRKREKKWFRVFVSCPERKAAFSVKAPLHQIVRLTIRQPFCLAAAHAVKHVSRLCKSGCRGKRTHTVIEAMTIAAYAVGGTQGYIYVRAEYPIAVERCRIAINQAREYGLLGKDILGTGFSFDIELRLGAGAFVCGEETALMVSVEGNRGEPRPRPPFPANKGLFGKPTLLNNVETYANITQIILNGPDWFASMGTEKSKGTKVFALGGKIVNTGLVEVPMGTTLREIVYDIGGGIPKGKQFKAAQTGGPSGGCIPPQHLDVPIDYDKLIEIGSMMGSGGLIVMDEDTCMVDIAKFFLEFTVDESCGKCTPCRIGTKRLLEMLTKVTDGTATLEDLDKMEELCYYIKENSLCGLGQTAPNPVLSTLRYFREEYETHIKDKRCPAKVCKKLVKFNITDACKGCTLCKRNCPVGAISGEVREKHVIDQSKCIKCGVCMDNCRFKAIVKE